MGAESLLVLLLLAGCQFDASTRISLREAQDSDVQSRDATDPIADASSNSPVPDASPPIPTIEVRINIYGPALDGADLPGAWIADPGQGGACGPGFYDTNDAITNTVDDTLFQGHAWGNPLLCNVGQGALPPGSYQVTLHFAETYFGSGCPGGGGNGSRRFDIQLEGSTRTSDLDLHSLVACTLSGGTPHAESFVQTISDGTLNIEMPARANNAMISGIELVSLF